VAAKRIQCGPKDCDGIVAHQISDKTFQVGRKEQRVTMTGDHWSGLATCPVNPKHQTSIVVTDGKVDASDLRYKEEVTPTSPGWSSSSRSARPDAASFACLAARVAWSRST
jgi:hypothetical protein